MAFKSHVTPVGRPLNAKEMLYAQDHRRLAEPIIPDDAAHKKRAEEKRLRKQLQRKGK